MRELLPFVVVGLASGSVYGLAGTGLVLTYKTSGIFNFAHGTVAAVIAYAFYDLRVRSGLPWPVAFVITLLVITPVIAFLFERIASRLAEAPPVMSVVATIGLVIALQQLTIIRYGAQTLRSPAFLPSAHVSIGGVNIGADQMIIVAVGLASTFALTILFRATRLGLAMRGVVDNAELAALAGVSPRTVRRWAWAVGTGLAGLAGILLAPTVGLDSKVLTLLVIQAFGAAALGAFTSIPMTYLGGLALGILAALSTRYVTSFPALVGLPPSLPFIALFCVLVAAPRGWLTNITTEARARVASHRHVSPRVRAAAVAIAALAMLRVPALTGARLPLYTVGLATMIVLLSLALLVRMSGQISLAQLSFAGIGAAASARLSVEAGIPWLAAVILGAAVAIPVGAVLAIPAIRRSGLYLALATFGFAVLVERMAFGTSLLFGARGGSELPAPRPSFARGDHAYFYVVVAFVLASVAIVVVVHRSRLGRLLRAMADSPVALSASGTNVTQLKVIVFCVAAFLAGVGGALLGPVTGTTSVRSFDSFSSLLLVVVLSIVPGREIAAAAGAAVALVVVPGYITGATLNHYLPVLFGGSAVLVAMTAAGTDTMSRLALAAAAARRRPGPMNARMARAVHAPGDPA